MNNTWLRLAELSACVSAAEMKELVNIPDPIGLLPVHVAASNGSTQAFEDLRAIDPEAELLRPGGRAVLHFAAQGIHRNISTVSKLLGSGEDACVRADDGSSIAHDCVGALKNVHRTDGREGISSDFQHVIQELTAHGCDTEWRRADQKTPLHLLCDIIAEHGYCYQWPWCPKCSVLLACAEFLTSRASTIMAKDEQGRTILNILFDGASYLPTQGRHEGFKNGVCAALILRVLETCSSDNVKDLRSNKHSALGIAADANYEALTLRLIELGCDVDILEEFDGSFVTPLQLMCSRRTPSLSAAEMALERTKDLTQTDHAGWSLLHLAAAHISSNGPAIIDLLVEAGVPLNIAGGSHGGTALMSAIHLRSTANARALIARGADVSIRDTQGWTAFSEACYSGDVEMIQLLFDAGASWDFIRYRLFPKLPKKQQLYRTREFWLGPIQLAACAGESDALEKLLQSKDDGSTRLHCSQGPSPLWLCSYYGHKEATQTLIKHVYSANDTEAFELVSCLQVAARHGHTEVMKILLKNGCNVSAKDRLKRTALDHATTTNQQQAIQVLSAHSQTHLKSGQRVDDTRMHPIENQNVLASRVGSYVPEFLMELIKQSDISAIEQMHRNGTDMSDAFQCGSCTPILIALVWDQHEIANFLLDKGVRIDSRTCFHHTQQNSSCCELAVVFADRLSLLTKILDRVQHASWHSDTKLETLSDMLCIAASCGNIPAMNEILKRHTLQELSAVGGGANGHIIRLPTLKPPFKRSGRPSTNPRKVHEISSHPLVAAVQQGQKESAGALLAVGADVNSPGLDASTPLHVSVIKGFKDCVTLLLHHGANPNAVDVFGWTPVHHAARYGDLHMLDLLASFGADLTKRTHESATILREALHAGQLSTAQALLRRGFQLQELQTAPSDMVSIGGRAPSAAVTFVIHSHQHFEANDYLYGLHYQQAPPSITRTVIKLLKAETLVRNLTFSSPMAFCYSNDRAALHAWAAEGQLTFVTLLLEAGAFVNMESEPLGTPLMYACENGRIDVVKLLVRRGAILSYRKGTRTLSSIQAARHFPEIIAWLLIGRFMDQRKLPCSLIDRLTSTFNGSIYSERRTTFAPATAMGEVPWDATEFVASEDIENCVARILEGLRLGPFLCREDGYIESSKSVEGLQFVEVQRP